MKRTWILAVVVTMALIVAFGQPTAAWADDVTIKVIQPDKSPEPAKPDEPKPGESVEPDQPAEAVRAVGSGDRRLDRALRGVQLTSEQVEKLKPILEAARKKSEQAREERSAKLRELSASRNRPATDGSQPAAGGSGTSIREQMGQVYSQARASSEQARRELVEQIVPTLTEEQAAKFKAGLEQRGDTPAERRRRTTRFALDRVVPGVKLTEQQQQQVTAIVQKQFEQGRERFRQLAEATRPLRERVRNDPNDAEARKALDQRRAAMRQEWQTARQTTRQAIEQLLTPEQKQQAEAGRREAAERRVEATIERTVGLYQDVGLTDPQKGKMAELTDAARDAMKKIEPDDFRGRSELRQQLRKDIDELLTEEQKKKVRPERGRGRRRGNRRPARQGGGNRQ